MTADSESVTMSEASATRRVGASSATCSAAGFSAAEKEGVEVSVGVPATCLGQVDGKALSIPVAGWHPSHAARAFKRFLDVVISLMTLVMALPVLIIAAVAIKLDSPGPVLFRQERMGVQGRRFRIYKLRTMVVGNDDSVHRAYVAALIRGTAPKHDGMFKLVRDSRITRVGTVLRRLSIDEVPQLWNVVRGEMSLVGPRPALPAEVDLYDDRAMQRLAAKPGITGLPQVSGRCELTFAEIVELDLEYLNRWSPWLELQILLRTPLAIVSKRGAA